MFYAREVLQIAEYLQEGNSKLTTYEALDIATKVQANRLFAEANVLDRKDAPSALEKIAMELATMNGMP